jgi:hypothetical protein
MKAARANVGAHLSLSGDVNSFGRTALRIYTQVCRDLSKALSTLSQVNPQQDPLLWWKETRVLDVLVECLHETPDKR